MVNVSEPSLWFDVESKYEATFYVVNVSEPLLWFDVESKYEATLEIVENALA